MRRLARDGDVPRIDGDVDGALRLVDGVHDAARVELHRGEPARSPARDAREHVRAGEARNERVGRRGDELGRRPGLADPAVGERGDATGEHRRVVEVVRDEEHGQVQLVEQLSQLEPERGARMRVERGERLVEEEHAGIARERPCEADALPLPARQLARPRACEMGDAKPLQQLGCTGTRAVGDVLGDRHVWEERVVLEHEADAPVLGRHVDTGAPSRRAPRRRAERSRAPASPAPLPRAVPSSFPAPEGPTSAKVSRPSARASSSRKERRGRPKSSSSASMRARASR